MKYIAATALLAGVAVAAPVANKRSAGLDPFEALNELVGAHGAAGTTGVADSIIALGGGPDVDSSRGGKSAVAKRSPDDEDDGLLDIVTDDIDLLIANLLGGDDDDAYRRRKRSPEDGEDGEGGLVGSVTHLGESLLDCVSAVGGTLGGLLRGDNKGSNSMGGFEKRSPEDDSPGWFGKIVGRVADVVLGGSPDSQQYRDQEYYGQPRQHTSYRHKPHGSKTGADEDAVDGVAETDGDIDTPSQGASSKAKRSPEDGLVGGLVHGITETVNHLGDGLLRCSIFKRSAEGDSPGWFGKIAGRFADVVLGGGGGSPEYGSSDDLPLGQVVQLADGVLDSVAGAA